MNPQEDRAQVWSRFWAQGALHSCGGSYAGNYEGDIRAFWQRVFGGLPPSARVLDVATGNGALPQILLQCRPETSLTCDAVDLAQIAPRWPESLAPAQRARLRFHGGMPVERLAFADGSFDLVTSQYGLEYSALDAAVAELRRVLVPGGTVGLVVHHSGSTPVRLAVAEVAHIDWLLAADGLLPAAGAMIEPMARSATEEGRRALASDAQAHAARDRFNTAQQGLARRLALECPDVLEEARQAVAQLMNVAARQGAEAAHEGLALLRGELQASRLRLAELQRHALDEAGVRALAASLAAPDGNQAVASLSDRGHLMAWSVLLRKGS